MCARGYSSLSVCQSVSHFIAVVVSFEGLTKKLESPIIAMMSFASSYINHFLVLVKSVYLPESQNIKWHWLMNNNKIFPTLWDPGSF